MRARAADFAMLNHGKRCVFADLKDPADRAQLEPLLRSADVLIEQFRPGVMARLGLGPEDLRAINPRLIYCSINGYGSQGPDAARVGHDLTYAAESGLLMLATAADGSPVMPHALLADIGGGAYPAVMNILLALLQRDRTGAGVTLEIAMADNLQPFLYPAYAMAFGEGAWPQPNQMLETGASPRYALYRAADGRWLAAAPAEEKFWRAFCAALDLPDAVDLAPAAAKAAIAARIAERPAAEWMERFAGKDCACALVMTFEEAMAAQGRTAQVGRPPRLPLPIVALFGGGEGAAGPPPTEPLGAARWR